MIGVAGAERASGRAVAAALAAAGHEVGRPGPDCSVLVDAATAPETFTDQVREDVLPALLGLAEESGARVVLLSSALVYADGGEEWVEASDPVVDPASAHRALPELEVALFGSGARFLVLRMGVLGDGAPEPGEAWIPVLDPGDLGGWVAAAVARDLSGVYDAVSRCVRGRADRSRRVSGAALVSITGVAPA